MKKGIVFAILCLASALSAYPLDKTIRIGGEAGWDSLRSSDGVAVAPGHRGYRDLTLSSGAGGTDVSTDLLIHFDSLPLRDETDRYRVTKGESFLLNTRSPYQGTGCAAFSGPGSAVTVRAAKAGSSDAPFFSRRSEANDFTIEFWLFPANLETGETILRWESARMIGKRVQPQLVSCEVSGGRLEWNFRNLFVSPDGKDTAFQLEGRNPSVPRRWTHHMVRFDASTGMLEYLVDGVTEDTVFANATGRENGTVFLPETGAAAPLVIGGSYEGFLDEFRISFSSADPGRLSKYADRAGSARTEIFDLGFSNSTVTRIDSRFTAEGSSGVEFMYRVGEEAATWTDDNPEWLPFRPGAALDGAEKGRYAQIGMELYPDGTGKISPSVSDITLHFTEDLPPAPPAGLIATAKNGSVSLSWKAVPEADLKGYLVYYGSAPGEYFGVDADLGQSPIDVGNVTKITIGGLKNGKLYYFAVAAYDGAKIPHASGFSPEAFARPSRLEN